MRSLVRILLVLVVCVAAASGVSWMLAGGPAVRVKTSARKKGTETGQSTHPEQALATLLGSPGQALTFTVGDRFEDGGYSTAMQSMAPLKDRGSLQELREAVRGRGRRGISVLRARYERQKLDKPLSTDQAQEKLNLEQSIGFLYMYEGRFAEAASWLEKALQTGRSSHASAEVNNRLIAVLGIVAMRRGEIDNCLECIGPSSCIFPIGSDAVHTEQHGSREAVKWFTEYLQATPRDLRIIWLLNIAYMTLGEHPSQVPPQYLIPARSFRSADDVGRFQNVAKSAGLTARGPNQAGGSIFDDFTGDGLPDLLSTSLDADLGASLYVNRGDGTFEDRSAAAGLGQQIYALNVTRADFDNDGSLDVLLLRGAWEKPLRLSLLRNKGNGSFDDVTVASGLAQPIACESAAWGDYDNDGWLDVFVCGEFLAPGAPLSSPPGDPTNRCRLYHNLRNGRFEDVAAAAGVTNDRCAKGAAWGDYDGDGRLDLFVSNMGQPCRLYHNDGDGKFTDRAPELGITGADVSFACWFWDYDNDGLLDLYVNDYRAKIHEVLCSALGLKLADSSHPRLYRNLGAAGFREVSRELGLDRAMAPMGANFGDIDNDGYLDLYLGTGDMSYEGLDVSLMFKNVEGGLFEDITTSSGTGHLQKGHGVSFADWDCDGDLDLFVELGGATPGDQAYNALFLNPGQKHHWLKVRLVGTETNRSAIGAKIKADIKSKDGRTRSIYRTIGNNSSFGGNSLVELIGLLDDVKVEQLTISWPTTKTTQVFRDVAADQAIEITEKKPTYKILAQKPVMVPGAGRG